MIGIPGLRSIEPDAGVVYNVVMGFRIAGVLFWLGMGVVILRLLFESNLLTSRTGLIVVGAGALLFGSSVTGATVS